MAVERGNWAQMLATCDAMEPPFWCGVGKRLRELRKRARMTQAMLATAIDVSRASVANMEVGRQRISLWLLYKIHKQAFNIRPLLLAMLKDELGGRTPGAK